MAKTRAPHRCAFCNEVIPQGVEVDSLEHEDFSYGRFTNDITPLYAGRGFGRRYWHRDCAVISELTGLQKRWSGCWGQFSIERCPFTGRVIMTPNNEVESHIYIDCNELFLEA